MKPLEQLTNIDRAKLMHQLFPGEIKEFLKFSLRLSAKVIASADELTTTWEHGFITPKFWVVLAGNVRDRIESHDKQLEKQSQLFADQLFEGYTALFSADAVTKYARFSNDSRFKAAAQMLFGSTGPDDDYHNIIYEICVSYSHDFLFEAVNESMRQQGKPGITTGAKPHLSHETLATLAATIIIQTDKLDKEGHFIDAEGKYKVNDH